MKKKHWVSSALMVGFLTMEQLSVKAQDAKIKSPELITPKTKVSQMVVSHKEVGQKPYLSFPTLTRVNDQEVLITFKRGTSHGGDPEANSDLLRFNTVTNQVLEHKTLGRIAGQIFQLTVPVQIAKNDLRFYVDLQSKGHDSKNYREGMLYTQTTDEGKTIGPWKAQGQIEGVEYGYPFDFIVEGKVVYMLAMSFGYMPGKLWSVAVLKSEDGAKTWKKVKDITQVMGGPINESCFTRVGDEFFVVSRGYANQETKIARFDKNFKLLQVSELTGKDLSLRGYIGWPRIFHKDNKLYVMGRLRVESPQSNQGNAPESKNMRLGLVRVNPQDLTVDRISLLDNEDGSLAVRDGYYADSYWQKTNNELWFNAITYRALGSNEPDIMRFAFKWDDIK
jgi:hypothetical protein